MDKIDRCLAEVQAVRNVAVGIDPPYVARSRIGRLATSTAALVATTLGIPDPKLPRATEVRDGHSPDEIRRVAVCCNRIIDISRHIRQPSEPLEERWKRGWEDLLVEIGTLEHHLNCLRMRQSNSA